MSDQPIQISGAPEQVVAVAGALSQLFLKDSLHLSQWLVSLLP